MPRYFLHLRDGSDEVLDPEGSEMPEHAVAGAALAAARDCLAADVKKGQRQVKRVIAEMGSGH